MAKTFKYLHYDIVLTSKAVVDAAQLEYPGGIFMAPDLAATTYSAPIQATSAAFTSPSIRSPWIIAIPDANYPTNVSTITRKVGGWFGIHLLFGSTYVYKWVGKFIYSAGTTAEIAGVPTEVVAIAQRKNFIGFEAPIDGESLSIGASAATVTRAASRHADGFGYSYRDPGDNVDMFMTGGGGVANANTWERFYFQPMALPTISACRIWACGATNGACIRYAADGRLSIWAVTGGVESLQATSADTYPLLTWQRVDIVLHSAAAAGGTIKVYIRRKEIFNIAFAGAVGLSAMGATHTLSTLGDSTAGASEGFECNFDDWIASEWPTQDSGGRYAGLDWLNGSKVQKVFPSALNAGNAWLGDYRYLANDDPFHAASALPMTSIVSGAALVTDMRSSRITAQLGSLGAVAFTGIWFVQQQTSVAGAAATFGWRFNGVLDLAAQALTVNALTYIRRMYRPSGLTAPIASLTPLELHHIKTGNVSNANCYAVAAAVELIGTFGDEDIPLDVVETVRPDTFAAKRGSHASAYPETPWASAIAPPVSPVIVHSGTYIGNSTVQELQFRAPVTWLIIKRESATAGGGNWWWTGMFSSHGTGVASAFSRIQALIDPSYVASGVEDTQQQRTVVRIAGLGADYNFAGDTYNYIAISDPGARFTLNGAFQHRTVATAETLALQNALFRPGFVLVQRERIGTVDSSFLLFAKGAGHTGTNGSPLNAIEIANFGGALTIGSLLTGAGLHNDSDVAAFAAFRVDDNSSDPNKHKVLRMGSYTGDGAASRTIGFTGTASGLRPLFAIVVPHNAASFMRTPSNTGTQSHNCGTGASILSTGITAGGIDSMTVGSLGNTNAIVYDYFVILGSPTAGNGGWSIDGEFAYIEPDQNFDLAEPVAALPVAAVPVEVAPTPNPGTGLTEDCGSGTVCVEMTTRIVNLALMEIGVDKILVNACTDATREAVLARTAYEQAVRHTLITYPWPFATKYAALVLVATQPTDADWTYAYRQPTDCIFPRRLSVTRGTAADPTPPPIGLSSDAAGGIILTNQAAAMLEYTARPACVGYNGDDLFIEALKWRLAAALAPPLTRIADEAERCMKQFEIIIQKAESTIKQGVPGARPAASTLDTTAAAIAANVQIVNRALVRIGAKTIANLTTEQSREAISAALIFEDELRSTLRDHPWAFATRYSSAPALVTGSAASPTNTDWTYAHRLPTDIVMLRRLALTGTGRSFEEAPFPFRLSSDATGGLLFSNELSPKLEYTARLQDVLVFADPVFRDALAWRLAASLAPSLAEVNPYAHEQHGRGPAAPQDPTRRDATNAQKHARRLNTAQWAWSMYFKTLPLAKTLDMNEQQMEPHPDAEWIRDRE